MRQHPWGTCCCTSPHIPAHICTCACPQTCIHPLYSKLLSNNKASGKCDRSSWPGDCTNPCDRHLKFPKLPTKKTSCGPVLFFSPPVMYSRCLIHLSPKCLCGLCQYIFFIIIRLLSCGTAISALHLRQSLEIELDSRMLIVGVPVNAAHLTFVSPLFCCS